MSSGRIRDFNEPSQVEPGPTILSQATKRGAEIAQQPQPEQVEVTVHEEVIREGQEAIRHPSEEDGVEIRFRQAKNPKAWEDVKRGLDA